MSCPSVGSKLIRLGVLVLIVVLLLLILSKSIQAKQSTYFQCQINQVPLQEFG